MPQFETDPIKLEVLRVVSSALIDAGLEPVNARVEIGHDWARQALVTSLSYYFHGLRSRDPHRVPRRWWDHLNLEVHTWLADRIDRHEWAGDREAELMGKVFRWLHRQLPEVQYRELERYAAVCPHLTHQPRDEHLRFIISKREAELHG